MPMGYTSYLFAAAASSEASNASGTDSTSEISARPIAPVWSQPVHFCFRNAFCFRRAVPRPPVEGRVGVTLRPLECRVDAAPARAARFSPPFAAAVEASLTDAALRVGAFLAQRRQARREGLPVQLLQCSASRATQGLAALRAIRLLSRASPQICYFHSLACALSLPLLLSIDRVLSLRLLRPRHDHFA